MTVSRRHLQPHCQVPGTLGRAQQSSQEGCVGELSHQPAKCIKSQHRPQGARGSWDPAAAVSSVAEITGKAPYTPEHTLQRHQGKWWSGEGNGNRKWGCWGKEVKNGPKSVLQFVLIWNPRTRSFEETEPPPSCLVNVQSCYSKLVPEPDS